MHLHLHLLHLLSISESLLSGNQTTGSESTNKTVSDSSYFEITYALKRRITKGECLGMLKRSYFRIDKIYRLAETIILILAR